MLGEHLLLHDISSALDSKAVAFAMILDKRSEQQTDIVSQQSSLGKVFRLRERQRFLFYLLTTGIQ